MFPVAGVAWHTGGKMFTAPLPSMYCPSKILSDKKRPFDNFLGSYVIWLEDCFEL